MRSTMCDTWLVLSNDVEGFYAGLKGFLWNSKLLCLMLSDLKYAGILSFNNFVVGFFLLYFFSPLLVNYYLPPTRSNIVALFRGNCYLLR